MAADLIINPDGTPVSGGAAQAGAARPAAGGDVVIDGSTQTFLADVIEASQQVAVVVDFWAPWCGPCKQLGPTLEKLVRQAGGLVRLVKINVDENQELAAQMRIQSIPAVYAFRGGQPVDGFVGALPESQLRAFVDRVLGDAKPPLDIALDQAAAALEAGDAASAAAIYGEILDHDASNPKAIAGTIRAAMAADDRAGARQFIEGLGADARADAGVAAAISALELAEASTATGDLGELRTRVAASPTDHQARLDLALALYGGGDAEAAIAELVELVRRDREWNEQAARKQLVKIFDALGPTHPLTAAGRRQLSSVLFA